MYNLLVASFSGVWEWSPPNHNYTIDRFLEYTDPVIVTHFKKINASTITELCNLPTLFAYEKEIDKPAKLGRITSIKFLDRGVDFTFHIDHKSRPISRDSLMEMLPALGILDDREMNRTHWAIKDIDLLDILQAPPIVRDKKLLPSANRIALKAARSILAPPEPFEVLIANTTVKVEAKCLSPDPWPGITWGLVEESDGPWPQSLLLDCSWQGGKTQLIASALRSTDSYYRDLVALQFSARLTSEQIIWLGIAGYLKPGLGNEVQLQASFSLLKRIPGSPEEQQRREKRIRAVKKLVRDSGLPLLAEKRLEAFSIALPEVTVRPSPSVALRRLTQLALLKLPFWVKNPADVIEGRAYLDPDNRAWHELEKQPLDDRDTETDTLSEGPTDEGETVERASAHVDDPPNWFNAQLELQSDGVQACITKRNLVFSERLIAQLCAALSSGKHLLLVGPPGTGKTEIANALANAARDEGYCDGAFVATASADWSTFDTIGGYTMEKDGNFAFRSGVFLRAIEQRKWLLLDEVNRADIDRCFGELMTVLAGGRTDTPFTQRNGAAISIGGGAGESHRVPATFRVLATMNTWDKTSLFRLSYAVQRRFALVHIDAPSDKTYAQIIDKASTTGNSPPPLETVALERMKRLFCSNGLLGYRQIGPAIAIDMVCYQRCRQAGGDAMVEAEMLFLLPQLQSLDIDLAVKLRDFLYGELQGWARHEAIEELLLRFEELFPGTRFVAP